MVEDAEDAEAEDIPDGISPADEYLVYYRRMGARKAAKKKAAPKRKAAKKKATRKKKK